MRYLTIALFLIAACSRPMTFIEFREPGGEFSVSVPTGWHIDERGPFTRRPIAEVWWLGEIVDQHEGWPIGVMICVRRLDRHPDPRQKVYREKSLGVTDAIFAGKSLEGLSVTKAEHSGYPARLVVNDDYAESKGDNLFHGPVKEFPSRLRALIIQTPDFYYVLEYRSVRDRFERYLPAFEKLTASFQLHKK